MLVYVIFFNNQPLFICGGLSIILWSIKAAPYQLLPMPYSLQLKYVEWLIY